MGKDRNMYLQRWALGRAASVKQLKSKNPSFEYVSAVDIPLSLSRGPLPEEYGDNAPRPRPTDQGRDRRVRGTCGYTLRRRGMVSSVGAWTVVRFTT